MKLPDKAPGQSDPLRLQIDAFWDEVLDALRSHSEPSPGFWNEQVDQFRRRLTELKAEPQGSGMTQSLADGIYHFNPMQIADAIATGRFRLHPDYPDPNDLLNSLLEMGQRLPA